MERSAREQLKSWTASQSVRDRLVFDSDPNSNADVVSLLLDVCAELIDHADALEKRIEETESILSGRDDA